MQLTSSKTDRLCKLAVRLAVTRLHRRGFVGESARARVMSDHYWRDAAALVASANPAALAAASCLLTVRQLASAVQTLVLRSEIAARSNR